jgi:hypothetical protein
MQRVNDRHFVAMVTQNCIILELSSHRYITFYTERRIYGDLLALVKLTLVKQFMSLLPFAAYTVMDYAVSLGLLAKRKWQTTSKEVTIGLPIVQLLSEPGYVVYCVGSLKTKLNFVALVR